MPPWQGRARGVCAQPVCRQFGAVMHTFARRWLTVIVVIVLMSAAVPAHGQSYSSCYRNCMIGCTGYGQSGSYACTTRSCYCSGKCMGGGGDVRSYGAIAYSPRTRAYGYVVRYGNRAEAQRRAKSECGKHDCQIAACTITVAARWRPAPMAPGAAPRAAACKRRGRRHGVHSRSAPIAGCCMRPVRAE